MFLARLQLNRNRTAVNWTANPYRVHQRLKMAYEGDPRLLFRIEETSAGIHILVQSHARPDWTAAFANFPVLRCPPEYKPFGPQLATGRRYRFRLRVNPTVKRNGKRWGLVREEDQQAWLSRKLAAAGAELLGYRVAARERQNSRKNPAKDSGIQTHFAVLFEGVLKVTDPVQLKAALEQGIGPAKGYGFGLLSLARG
jgi:CRISPR system Cascade subunit CasE